MSIEEAIKNLRELAPVAEEMGCIDSAREKRQIANWLQELKERREKESRIEIGDIAPVVEPTPSEKIEGYVISPETIEAMGKLVKTLTETLPEIISGALEEYFRRKEEES